MSVRLRILQSLFFSLIAPMFEVEIPHLLHRALQVRCVSPYFTTNTWMIKNPRLLDLIYISRH